MMITITRTDIALVIGILGFLLGVFNLWLTWKRGRVSLKVTPKTFYPCGDDGVPDPAFFHTGAEGEKLPKYLCIEIANKGVDATITEVGFLIKGSKNRCAIVNSTQFPPYRKDLPFRLETHSSTTIYADGFDEDAYDYVTKFSCAYADVASGKRFTGKSGIPKQLRKLRRQAKGAA